MSWVLVVVGLLGADHPARVRALRRGQGHRDARRALLPLLPPEAGQHQARRDRVRDRHDPARRLREDHRDEPGGAGGARSDQRRATSGHGPGTDGRGSGRAQGLLERVEASGQDPSERRTARRPKCSKRAYYNQPVWKRVVVIAAGPAMNIVMAFVILFVLAFSLTRSPDRDSRSAGRPATARGGRAQAGRQGRLDRRRTRYDPELSTSTGNDGRRQVRAHHERIRPQVRGRADPDCRSASTPVTVVGRQEREAGATPDPDRRTTPTHQPLPARSSVQGGRDCHTDRQSAVEAARPTRWTRCG